MRILARFTSAQIEATAGINRDNASRYIRALTRTGYLRVADRNVSGQPGSFNLYQLVRNTGPIAPIAWENGQVYDANTDEVYGEQHRNQVAA